MLLVMGVVEMSMGLVDQVLQHGISLGVPKEEVIATVKLMDICELRPALGYERPEWDQLAEYLSTGVVNW